MHKKDEFIMVYEKMVQKMATLKGSPGSAR